MAMALVLTVVFLWIILAVVPTFLRERREDQERRTEMLKWARRAEEERKSSARIYHSPRRGECRQRHPREATVSRGAKYIP